LVNFLKKERLKLNTIFCTYSSLASHAHLIEEHLLDRIFVYDTLQELDTTADII